MNKKLLNKNKKNKGFTVLELLVSTAIFLVILLITMANLRQGNRISELKLKSLQIASDLRRVQNYALSAQTLPNGNIPDRWGIHFTNRSNEYIIFAEMNCSVCPFGYEQYFFDNTSTDYSVQIINLSNRFQINGMNDPENPCGTKIKAGIMDIVFTVPRGEIFINGIQPDNSCGSYNPSWVSLIYLPSGRYINTEINWISGKITTTDINKIITPDININKTTTID